MIILIAINIYFENLCACGLFGLVVQVEPTSAGENNLARVEVGRNQFWQLNSATRCATL